MKEKKIFFLYTIAIAILIIIGFSFLYIFKSKENYYLVVRAYNVIEYSILAYFFTLYIKNKVINKVLLYSTVVYLIFCIYDYIIEKVPEIPFIPFSVEHILLLIFIVYYFFEIMNESVTEPVYQKAIFWICVAFIINSSGNFFLFLYSKNSYNDDIFKRQYTIIYTTVSVIKNLLLCIAILIKETPKNDSDNLIFDVDLDSLNQSKNKN